MEESLIEIRHTDEKGRGLFSLVDLKRGDIIFEEEPIVSCQFAWNEDYGYRACDHCLRSLESAQENARRLSINKNVTLPYSELCSVDKTKHVSCPTCNVNYCSLECQELAWNKYHKTLCHRKFEKDNSHPLEILKHIWKDMHYPPETCSIMLLARIFAIIHQSEDKDAIFNVFQQFCHPAVTEEHFAYNLIGLKFSHQLNVLREQLVNCVPIESVPQWTTPEGFQSLVILVGMNGQGIGTSSVSDWVKNVGKLNLDPAERQSVDKFIDKLYEDLDEGVGDFLNNEGAGLYSIQSSINHSCSPNAEVAFPNSNYRLSVRCIDDVSAGDEICISYVDECVLERSRHSRQKTLKTNYFFQCKCSKCDSEMDQPDVTSDEGEESGDESDD